MRLIAVAVAILTILWLASCRPKEQGPQQEQAQPAPQQATASVHAGVVQEVIQATAYTYLRVKEQEKTAWIAVTRCSVNVGDTVYFADGLEMRDFTSKDLQRTFETIYFVSRFSTGSPPSAHGPSAPMSHQAKPATERLELSIERPEGGVSIGELFANRGSYADKTVLVRGQVTKVNRAIMDRNWVHLQDGTSDSGNYDLTITTTEEVTPGEVVTFEGRIALNKDFGSGYAYDVLMEDATKRNE
jgi:hypothetical protein